MISRTILAQSQRPSDNWGDYEQCPIKISPSYGAEGGSDKDRVKDSVPEPLANKIDE